MKKVKQVTQRITIWYSDEWDEYQVKVKGIPDATYHTDDKQDAVDTAAHMSTLAVNQ